MTKMNRQDTLTGSGAADVAIAAATAKIMTEKEQTNRAVI